MSYDAKPIFFMSPAFSTPEIKKAMESFFGNWLQKHSFSGELRLYHYTTIHGLKGILDSRSIWCSHISTLNDPSELHYGRDSVLSLLEERIASQSDSRIIKLLGDLTMYCRAYDPVLFHTYVACFCESDNLLSQWRGYSDKDGGYNIGLTFSSDTKFSHDLSQLPKENHIILRKIVYDKTDQNQIISDYISAVIDAAGEAITRMTGAGTGTIPSHWPNVAAAESVNILLDIILTLKNPAFSEEEEWRLIKAMSGDHRPELIEFRDGKDGPVPFLPTLIFNELNGNYELPLNSIRFGPMVDESQAKPMLDLLLQKSSTIGHMIRINPTVVNVLGSGYRIRTK